MNVIKTMRLLKGRFHPVEKQSAAHRLEIVFKRTHNS